MKRWGGAKARAWTRAVIAEGGDRCVLRLPGCTGRATTGDHIIPFSVDPTRALDVSNGRPACLSCNQRRGVRDVPTDARPRVDGRGFFESATDEVVGLQQSPPRARNKNAATSGNGGRR